MSTYPDDCLQSWLTEDTWWVKDDSKELRPGSLIWAFLPHVDLIPNTLEAYDRGEDYTSHSHAAYRITALRINSPPPKTDKLPVAGLTLHSGERHMVYKGKRRPAIVLSTGGVNVPDELISSMKPKSQVRPTITVAPYYGVESGSRAGWYEPFVERIKKCDFPQYVWDILPLAGADSSILRLDHVQPIGKHHNSYELTGYTLSEDGLDILHECHHWLKTGKMDKDKSLYEIRNALLGIGD